MSNKYREAIKKLGWTVKSAGQALGISRRSSTRFAAGEEVSAPVRKLLRVMLKYSVDPKEVNEF
jgi:hypothetical protein